jgi:hypothetical protein
LSPHDFPSIATNLPTDDQHPQESQGEQPQEPRTLPPRAQKKAVKKFSHALLNRYTNDQQKHENRQNRYQNLLQAAEEKVQRSNIAPRRRERVIQEQEQPQREPHKRTYRRAPTPTQTEMNFDTIISYLITNQSALTSLLTILQAIVTTSVPQGDHLDPQNVKLLQQKLLRLRPKLQRTNRQQSDSEVFTGEEDNMDSA